MIRILREEIRALDRSARALRSFGLLVGGVVLAVAAVAAVVFWLRGWSPGAVVYTLTSAGAALTILGAIAPTLLRPVYTVWMALAVVLGFIMTRVILTVVFFLVVTPIGLVMRLVGRDPLNRKADAGAPTYWLEKTYDEDPRARLEKYY